MRCPVALNTALAIAAGTPTMTTSPRPLTPIGSAIVVLGGQEGRVERGDVGVDRNQVVRQVGVDDAAVAVVGSVPSSSAMPMPPVMPPIA